MTKSIDPKVTIQLIQKKNQCFLKVLECILGSDYVFVKEAFKIIKINM